MYLKIASVTEHGAKQLESSVLMDKEIAKISKEKKNQNVSKSDDEILYLGILMEQQDEIELILAINNPSITLVSSQ